jgi:MFS family permease
MGALDSTIVILAFPAIAAGLHSDIATTIWIILIYLLVTAVTTTPFGRIGDLYGRSKMFNAGFAIFTIGSVRFLAVLNGYGAKFNNSIS